MQSFVTALTEEHDVDVSEKSPASTVWRLNKIVDEKRGELGKTDSSFQDALVEYWGTVSDLVQRQEHGAQREGGELVWEDARRVVFRTCILMYEVSRALR